MFKSSFKITSSLVERGRPAQSPQGGTGSCGTGTGNGGEQDVHQQEPQEPGADVSGREGPRMGHHLASPRVLPQTGVLEEPAPCDGGGDPWRGGGRSGPGHFLFHQGVGAQTGTGLHTLCGGLPGCGRGVGTAMPTGGYHQDGVQEHTMDVQV